jgi:5-methylcytosine-specific restriction endonuclease McrA
MTGPARRRIAARNRVKCRAWFRRYRARINAGLELCRQCGIRSYELRLAHLIAHARGGAYRRDNLTILCPPCDIRQGTQPSPLRSLADEEREYGAPPWPIFTTDLTTFVIGRLAEG